MEVNQSLHCLRRASHMHTSTSVTCTIQCHSSAHNFRSLVSVGKTSSPLSRLSSCSQPTVVGSPLMGRACNKRLFRHGQVVKTTASLQHCIAPALQLQETLTNLSGMLETIPPPYYLLYMLGTSFGLPLSEDALVVWVGGNVFRGVYGSWMASAAMLAYVYVSVVISDMVTFWLGRGLRAGVFEKLRNKFLRGSSWVDSAEAAVEKWSIWIGLVQRMTLGFPLCLMCGFLGVRTSHFVGGVLVGTVATMVMQLAMAYLLRDKPALCLTATAVLAIVEVAAPIAAVAGLALQQSLKVMRSQQVKVSDVTTAAEAQLPPQLQVQLPQLQAQLPLQPQLPPQLQPQLQPQP